MTKLSKTAALREAQAACGRPIRRSSTDYVCYVPYYDDRTDGPSAELQADSHPKIVMHRAHKVASIALALMGLTDTNEERIEAEEAMMMATNWGTVPAKHLVEAAIKRLSAKA